MKYGPPLFLGILAVVLHLCIYGSGLSVPAGSLHDPDAYMRLVRAETLVATGEWFNQTIARDNAPEGLEMHWSRPMDVLLIALASPFVFFMGWGKSLFISGLIVSPLLLIPALLFIDRLARNFLDFEGRLLAMLFFLCQPGILNYYVAGRPDHHSLILMLVVAVWTMGAQTLDKKGPGWRFAVLGWLCALGHWVSIEFLVPYAVLSAAFALLWVFQAETGRHSALFQIHHLAGCCLFLLIETPQAFTKIWWLDRMSGFHCFLFLAISVAWWGMVLVRPGNASKRFGVGMGAAAMATVCVFLAFPEMAKGPFGQVHPELKTVWLNHVQELHSLGYGVKTLTTGILSWLPALLPGVAWILYSLKKREMRKAWLSPLALSWIIAATGITLLSFTQKRWVCYADLLWIAPAVLGIRKWLEFCEPHRRFRLIRALTLVTVCAGPVLLANWMESDTSSDPDPKTESVVVKSEEKLPETGTFRDVLKTLSNPSGRTPLILLNFIDDGPEILYTSEHSTLSSPYHRNHHGILDAHSVLASPPESKTFKILNDRNVDFLLVSNTETEKSFYGATDDSLYSLLVSENPPPGFTLTARGQKPDGSIVLFYRYESDPSFHQQ